LKFVDFWCVDPCIQSYSRIQRGMSWNKSLGATGDTSSSDTHALSVLPGWTSGIVLDADGCTSDPWFQWGTCCQETVCRLVLCPQDWPMTEWGHLQYCFVFVVLQFGLSLLGWSPLPSFACIAECQKLSCPSIDSLLWYP
jgi:hypothetical protein